MELDAGHSIECKLTPLTVSLNLDLLKYVLHFVTL